MNAKVADLDYVFWGAPLQGRPFEEHIQAAAAGGFTSLALASSTVHEAAARGIGFAEMQRQANDAGVSFRHYDSLATWAPMQLTQEQLGDEMYDRWTTSVDEALDICSALDLKNVLLNAGFLKNTVPLPELIHSCAEFCERAASLGIWVDLEPMPFLGVTTIPEALSIIQGTRKSNIGLLIDTWHFAKSGQTLDAIRVVPAQLLRTVQVADGWRDPQGIPLEQETVTRRAWPGMGNLPVREILRELLGIGHVRSLGQEVFANLVEQSAEQIGRTAGQTLFSLLYEL